MYNVLSKHRYAAAQSQTAYLRYYGDTYDKIVFDDVRNNVILTAILAYMASEDPATTSRVKSILPMNTKTGEFGKWPEQKSPIRRGGLD